MYDLLRSTCINKLTRFTIDWRYFFLQSWHIVYPTFCSLTPQGPSDRCFHQVCTHQARTQTHTDRARISYCDWGVTCGVCLRSRRSVNCTDICCSTPYGSVRVDNFVSESATRIVLEWAAVECAVRLSLITLVVMVEQSIRCVCVSACWDNNFWTKWSSTWLDRHV